MSTLEDLKDAVDRLSREERSRFREWLLERDAEAWDREIEADARAGKLDFLAEEGLREFRAGKARKL
ncbi:MAG: hypothetical protein ACJ75H_21380 [Thermoanaerobaculia bacterium]